MRKAFIILFISITMFCMGVCANFIFVDIPCDRPEQDIPAANPPIHTGNYMAAIKKDGRKTAYLTFDDGPSSNTPKILDTLSAYNVKATFFVVGENAKKYPELVQREFEAGHIIGNHTYNHEYKAVYADSDALLSSITETEIEISNIIGYDNITRIFRFPGGSFGGTAEKFENTVSSMGYSYIDWNASNSDADGKEQSIEKCLESIKETCAGKHSAIILMHDSPSKQVTADALPEIIEYLKNEGYEFGVINP